MRAIGHFLLLGLVVCVSASPASAINLIYTWTGTITSVDPALVAESPPFAVSDPFTATAVIDDSTVGTPTVNPGQLVYTPVGSISLTLNTSYTINGTPGSSSLGVRHDPGNFDEFRAAGSGVFSAPDLGVWRPSIYAISLRETPGSVLASNALPTSLDINDWPNDLLLVTFIDTTSTLPNVSVQGDITGVSVTVPEPLPARWRGKPTMTVLLISGLVGLVAYSRRRSSWTSGRCSDGETRA